MTDWWLLGWFAAGLASASMLAAMSIWAGLRKGRRWYEVTLTNQPAGVVVMGVYLCASIGTDPITGAYITIGLYGCIIAAVYVATFWFKRRAQKVIQ